MWFTTQWFSNRPAGRARARGSQQHNGLATCRPDRARARGRELFRMARGRELFRKARDRELFRRARGRELCRRPAKGVGSESPGK